MLTCTACQNEIPRDDFSGPSQGDNNLLIGLFGAYGMFVESQDYVSESNANFLKDTGATFEANLCHDCAHKLCKENPWLEAIVNTHASHSHTLDYWEANPDHYGWDKKD